MVPSTSAIPSSSSSIHSFSGRIGELDLGAGGEPVGHRRGNQLAAREPHAAVLDDGRQQVGDADEAGHERLRRVLVDLLGRAQLLDHAVVHDGDPVGHRERLLLVVRHVDERDADLALDPLELDLHLLAQLEVERAERLVEQQQRRPVHERPRQRDALAHAARELRGPVLGPVAERDEIERLGHALADLRLGHLAPPQPERDVLGHVEVLEQRVGLEHRVDVALVGRHGGDVLAVEPDRARRRLLEAGDQPQGRRLAAARRPEQREELPLPDLQRHVLDRLEVAEVLADAFQLDRELRHASLLPVSTPIPLSRRPSRRGTSTAIAMKAADTTSMSVPMALMVGEMPKRSAE